MSDSEHARLLDQAHHSREDAQRARRLARQQTDVDIKNTLSRLADESEAAATALERQASDLKPQVQTQATRQQMQQARLTPPESDAPEKSRD